MRIVLVVICSAALACSGSRSSSDAGTDAGYTSGTVCHQLAQAQCDFIGRCFPGFNQLSNADCVAVQESICNLELEPIVSSVNANVVQPNSAAVAACVARMGTAPCPGALPPTSPATSVRSFDECRPSVLYMGTLPDGHTCKSPADCVAGDYCNLPPGDCAGVCTAFAKPGDFCGGGCDPTLGYCDTTQPQQVCVAFQTLGSSCQSTSQCALNLLCQGNACETPPDIGKPCGFSTSRLPYCAAGLACDVAPYSTSQGVCVSPEPDGASCHYHWSCAPGLVCRGMNWAPFPGAPPTGGHCGAPGQSGESCSYTDYSVYVGSDCGPGLACSKATNTCVAPPSVGDAGCDPLVQNCVGPNIWCSNGSGAYPACGPPPSVGEQCAWPTGTGNLFVQVPCTSGWCNSANGGSCAAASAKVGDPCTVDAQCVSNRCETNPNATRTCWSACP